MVAAVAALVAGDIKVENRQYYFEALGKTQSNLKRFLKNIAQYSIKHFLFVLLSVSTLKPFPIHFKILSP